METITCRMKTFETQPDLYLSFQEKKKKVPPFARRMYSYFLHFDQNLKL